TSWQFFGGESTLTYLTQMAGIAVQMFLSAAVGMAVLAAVVRGFSRRASHELGNFWVDLYRSLVYVLLPVSVVLTVILVWQGVPQTFQGHATATTLQGATQAIARGPVASQEAIKNVSMDGGGYYNSNSATPFENPTGLSNFIELFLILLIPTSLTYTFGRMVGSRRQGWAIFTVMSALFVAGVAVVYLAEQHGTPAQHLAGVNTAHIAGSTGGNMEGKEQRFGIANSGLWTAVTTVTSCGAVNAAFESLTGIGGLVPFANLSASETIFGGVGTGLYSMLLFVILAVFIGGLMVGRTPEYLGKKIEAREIKLVSIGVLFTPIAALIAAALATGTKYGRPSVFAEGPQGFSESMYAYLSQANNNGSAWAGYTGYYQPNPGNLGAHGITFADLLGGLTMMTARYVPILVVLAVAGSLVRKKVAPVGLGTMRTDTPTFVVLLGGVIVLVGALTFFPALLLGPIVQGLTNQVF
ncbi:MAG TPA: potassium-transporting ATPase subunit KdpA, partial [Conexibacter sp.]|nr:potassium-transporting ATPase subunit KdpA [Conexibacter sp.]